MVPSGGVLCLAEDGCFSDLSVGMSVLWSDAHCFACIAGEEEEQCLLSR